MLVFLPAAICFSTWAELFALRRVQKRSAPDQKGNKGLLFLNTPLKPLLYIGLLAASIYAFHDVVAYCVFIGPFVTLIVVTAVQETLYRFGNGTAFASIQGALSAYKNGTAIFCMLIGLMLAEDVYKVACGACIITHILLLVLELRTVFKKYGDPAPDAAAEPLQSG